MIMKIGLPVITLPFVINRIGVENYGVFSFTNSIISYFTMAAVLGIPDYASRAIARETATSSDIEVIGKTASEILVIQFISVSIVLILFFTLFYPFFFPEYRSIFLIFSILIASNYFSTEWFYMGQQKFKYIAIRSMITKLLNVAAILLVIKDGDDSSKYVLITVLTNVLNGLINISGIIPYLRFKNLSIKPHLKPIFILFGLSISGLINGSIDKTLTGFLVGPIYVGYYAIGLRLTRITQQVFSSLNSIVFPRVTAYLAKDDEAQSEKLIRFSMDYITLFSFPMILGLILYAKDIITLFFKPELLPAAGALIILTGTVPVIAILRIIRTHVLLARSKDKILIILSLITTFSNLLMNLILVPHYKHIGAATATLIAESSGMIFGMIYIRKKFKIRLLFPGQMKYFIAATVLLIPWWLGNIYLLSMNLILSLTIKVMISAILYFSMLYLIKDDLFYRYTKRYIIK